MSLLEKDFRCPDLAGTHASVPAPMAAGLPIFEISIDRPTFNMRSPALPVF
ncbi:MAG: hypothetical protein HC849_18595 [Oscillatoriales cyanobacterium RU_3_3]|nr:hypothetical protein [Oscillatoriales cyanobacterium RU_3_3]